MHISICPDLKSIKSRQEIKKYKQFIISIFNVDYKQVDYKSYLNHSVSIKTLQNFFILVH